MPSECGGRNYRAMPACSGGDAVARPLELVGARSHGSSVPLSFTRRKRRSASHAMIFSLLATIVAISSTSSKLSPGRPWRILRTEAYPAWQTEEKSEARPGETARHLDRRLCRTYVLFVTHH